MHTCEPPIEALNEWLTVYPSVEGSYGHLLLEQVTETNQDLINIFRPYFESAHLDAREHFHQEIAIDLHPDAGALGEQTCYPNCLPSKAHKGLFGEVMAGMLTEAFKTCFVGNHEWKIPIFLFRMHADVEAYLWTLVRDETREREIFGRFGSDFIGLSLNDQGAVNRIIIGEAKWRSKLTQGVMDTLMLGKWYTDKETGEKYRSRGIWFEMNRDTVVPHGLRQMQRLLQYKNMEEYQAAVLSIDKIIVQKDGPALPRTNLVLVSGNDTPTRGTANSLIQRDSLPTEYHAPHDLQVVELILQNGETLIDGIYSSLWMGK
ncbi:aminotransferase [Pseudomonas frederiksbergensis]|uniref:aminotransferase n=1 Tax=Pseudomonas frederiksbergensis TaxID=104087 RepID=UPI003CFF741F